MKIIQINAVYGSKSTGVIVKDIEATALKNGIDALSCIPNIGENDRIIHIGGRYEQKVHALITRLFGLQGFGSQIATMRLIKRLVKEKPDLLHLHNTHSNYINLPILFRYANEHRIPIVITLHDSWYFTGKCYHFLDIDCNLWTDYCCKCPKRKMEIPSLFDFSSYVFYEKKERYSQSELYIVGCSKWITSCAEKSPLLRKAHFSQIYNGVDTNTFRPSASDARKQYSLEGKFVILTMANKWFDPKNDPVRNGVIDKLSDKDRLVIVGCNERQMKEYADHRICTVGYTAGREALADIYRAANVFVNLTFVDTLPTVNMEAACCGTPVITYNAGGSAELVIDGKTGYVIKPLDTKALLASIDNVRNGLVNRDDCSDWAVKTFDKEFNYQSYIELYKKILHG